MSKYMTLEQEQQRLEQAYAVLQQRLAEAKKIRTNWRSDVREARKDIWDSYSHDPTQFDTAVDLVAENLELDRAVRTVQSVEQRYNRWKRMVQAAYFGRFDFQETGQTDEEAIYVGLSSLHDPVSGELFVHDWRAPVSSLYYDRPPGPASYESPQGLIDGELTLKRQYQIDHDRLIAMYDSGTPLGGELLQEVLSVRRDTRMRHIVATIQQEQNEAIRDDAHDLLIVQGAAGSGKTSIALQRVAYILFKHRGRLQPEHVVLFSPNELFQDYVSEVLPELGEANMAQTTFMAAADHMFRESLTLQTPFAMLEATGSGDLALADAVRAKGSESFLKGLSRYAEMLEQHVNTMVFWDLKIGSTVLISRDRLANWYYTEFAEKKSRHRIDRMKERIIEQLQRQEKQTIKRRAKRLFESGENVESEKAVLARAERAVSHRFEALREHVRAFGFVDLRESYRRLFSKDSLWKACFATAGWDRETTYQMRMRTQQLLDQNMLPHEDIAAYLWLQQALTGGPALNRVRHVLIDEAQDFSLLQFKLLQSWFPRARMTVLMDANQALQPHAVSPEQLMGSFADRSSRLLKLSKSYRSTKQIAMFAKALLPGGEPIEPVSRAGQRPLLQRLAAGASAADVIASCWTDWQQEEGLRSLVVITKTAAQAEALAEELRAVFPDLVLVTPELSKFPAGKPLVMPVYLAKGLEFDGVTLYPASAEAYSTDADFKWLYTACTRALHRLQLVADETSAWPDGVEAALASLELEEVEA